MPYVYYDELPEGTEAADVVSREDYDSVVTERDSYATQRDDALTRIEGAQREVREVKARYADAILGSNQRSQEPKAPDGGRKQETKYAMSAKEMFAKEV